MSLRRPVAALSLLIVLGMILMSCDLGDDDDDDEPAATAAAIDTPAAAAPTDTEEAAAPTDTEEPAAPTDTEEPAEPTDTEEPEATDTEEPATEPEVEVSTPLGPCSAIELVRAFETAVPVTPEPTSEPTATETGATPEPTATLPPAPTEDRIGFPEGYQDSYHLMYVFDRPDNVQVRVVCGNDMAAMAEEGEPLPYGSILLMETWRAKSDESGAPVLDDEGHFIRETLTGVFMMKKEQGFGEAYQDQRSGEWEYVAYRPDGSYLAAPERTNACAACHQTAIEEFDFVFRLGQVFDPEGATTPPEVGENEVSIFDYTFMPGTIEVTAGTTVTWVNNDVIVHTVTASDGSFDSGPIQQGETFSFTFESAGEFEYTSSASRNITPGMVVVVE